ncbi:uncharacterized protein LOC142584291 isoform X1 [Dermacentor variabilis]|uniref:uncharacterized protein LOC142584291 isoform X1 n=1 Tax=Dermacentor variabilis TaxID=34621 RepID=UPI003F5C0E81
MSVDLKPGTSSVSSTRSEDWPSRRTSDTQSRTETTSGTTTSSASSVSSRKPSGTSPANPPSAPMFSGTTPKSQSLLVTDKSKTSDLKERFEPGSSAKTLPSTVRLSFVRTVRLGTTPTNTETVAASVTTEDDVGLNTSETDGSARNGRTRVAPWRRMSLPNGMRRKRCRSVKPERNRHLPGTVQFGHL